MLADPDLSAYATKTNPTFFVDGSATARSLQNIITDLGDAEYATKTNPTFFVDGSATAKTLTTIIGENVPPTTDFAVVADPQFNIGGTGEKSLTTIIAEYAPEQDLSAYSTILNPEFNIGGTGNKSLTQIIQENSSSDLTSYATKYDPRFTIPQPSPSIPEVEQTLTDIVDARIPDLSIYATSAAVESFIINPFFPHTNTLLNFQNTSTNEITSLQSMLDDKTDVSITTTIQTTLTNIQTTLSAIENTLFTPIDIDFLFASSLQPNVVTVHIYDVIQQRISEPIYAPVVTSTNTWTLETVPTIKWSGSNKIRLVFRIQKVAGHTGTGFDEIKLTQGGTVHYYDFYSGTPYSTPIKAQQFETNTSGFFDVDLLTDVDDVTSRPSGSLFDEIAVTSDAITNADGNVLIQSRTIGGIYSQQLVYFGDHAAGTGQLAYVSTPEITLSVDINHVGLNLPIPSPEPKKLIDFSFWEWMATSTTSGQIPYDAYVYLLLYDERR